MGLYANILAQFGSVWVCTVIFWLGLVVVGLYAKNYGSIWVGLSHYDNILARLGRCESVH